MYTTRTRTDVRAAGAPDAPLCDTFSLGERPIVVVEGFGDVKEAVLELATDGNVIHREKFPMKSGQLEGTGRAASSTYQNAGGHWVETVFMDITAGFQVDLGLLPPGVYDLALKTNDVVATVAHFKVTMPPELENERQAIDSERKKLEQAQTALKELNLEIEHEQSLVDRSNAGQLSAFNSKVEHYNELVKKAQVDDASFNARVQSYNAQLSSYGPKRP
jgi:hypothetical protein